MTKLSAFVRLDLLTIKPVFNPSFLLFIFVLITIFTAIDLFIVGGIGFSLLLGIWFSSFFIAYPFSISEKSNMNALYPMLTINKKTVVLGRYIHTMTFGLGILFFAITPVSIIRLINTSDMFWVYTEMVLPVIASTLIIVLSYAILLPIYFKFNFKRASIALMLPVLIFVGTLLAIENSNGNIINTILAANITGIVLISLLLALVAVYVSYKLSLAFYKKRDF